MNCFLSGGEEVEGRTGVWSDRLWGWEEKSQDWPRNPSMCRTSALQEKLEVLLPTWNEGWSGFISLI